VLPLLLLLLFEDVEVWGLVRDVDVDKDEGEDDEDSEVDDPQTDADARTETRTSPTTATRQHKWARTWRQPEVEGGAAWRRWRTSVQSKTRPGAMAQE
jgi:hypothetical protein